MHIIGLTGGMGSGKSTVANFFNELGIRTYNSDSAARRLMQKNQSLRSDIIRNFGELSYKREKLNTDFLAQRVFGDIPALRRLNNLVHPIVNADFNSWVVSQKGSYCLREEAILFESGSFKQCHWVLSIVTPLELRIQRITKRSNLNKTQIKNRLNHQWSDQERYNQSDIIIENNYNLKILREKVRETHLKILDLIQKTSLHNPLYFL